MQHHSTSTAGAATRWSYWREVINHGAEFWFPTCTEAVAAANTHEATDKLTPNANKSAFV